MITQRKVRSDAKLEQLSEAQHERLVFWLDDENCSYTEVAARVRQEFGVSVGRTAVSGYYQRHVAPLRHQDDSEAAMALAALSEGPFDAAAVQLAKRLAWSALSRPAPQVKTAATLLDLVRRAARQTIAERRLELEARRVAVREKEAAYRARRRPPSVRSETDALPPSEGSGGRPDRHGMQGGNRETPPLSENPSHEGSLVEIPTPTVPSAQATLPEPAAPLAPHQETPPAAAETMPPETPSPATPYTDIPSQKTPQNPPLNSPCVGLIPAPAAAEIRPVSPRKISPAEIARLERLLKSAEARLEKEEKRLSLAHDE